MRGTVFNIQRFSTLDGPGIRTTAYLKGCTLSCRWCHNPESIAPEPRMQYFAERCANCGCCATVCPNHCHAITALPNRSAPSHAYDRTRCTACGKCADCCAPEALVLCGQDMDHAVAVSTAARDKDYFDNSGGGLTVSGGEPLMQPAFCNAILRGAKDNGISTALDTALNVPKTAIEEVVKLTDLWLIDLKHMDDEKHRHATGVSNERILDNLRYLLDNPARIWIRLPLIRGINDSLENIEAVAALLQGKAAVEKVELLPYHNYGVHKAGSVAADRQREEFLPPEPERMDGIRAALAEMGVAAFY